MHKFAVFKGDTLIGVFISTLLDLPLPRKVKGLTLVCLD